MLDDEIVEDNEVVVRAETVYVVDDAVVAATAEEGGDEVEMDSMFELDTVGGMVLDDTEGGVSGGVELALTLYWIRM